MPKNRLIVNMLPLCASRKKSKGFDMHYTYNYHQTMTNGSNK